MSDGSYWNDYDVGDPYDDDGGPNACLVTMVLFVAMWVIIGLIVWALVFR